MKQVTTTLYTIEELKEQHPTAYQKVINEYRSTNDYYFLPFHLKEELIDQLTQYNITFDPSELDAYGSTKHPNNFIRYSLSYSQGDGVSFVGKYNFQYNDTPYQAIITPSSSHYIHEKSTDIQIIDPITTEEPYGTLYHDIEQYFTTIYINICKHLKDEGYSLIESEDDENYIFEILTNSEETYYTKDGTQHVEA